MAAAHDRFRRLDVIVNNAGHGLRGAVEEVQETDIRELLAAWEACALVSERAHADL